VGIEALQGNRMLKITREKNNEIVFKVSGRIEAQNVAQLETLISSETGGLPIVLDLKELTLVDEDAVRFLEAIEVKGIELKNCSSYIREWITRERARRSAS
jgi:anti-anti-sigma regulatory factor